MKTLPALMIGSLALAACDSGTGGNTGAQVALRMDVQRGASANVLGGSAVTQTAPAGSLVLTGSNGTLTLTDVRVIVSRFQLGDDCGHSGAHTDKGGDGEKHDSIEHAGKDCGQQFRSTAKFVKLPLGGGTVALADDQIPAGTYDRLKLKVDNLDLDDDDDDATEHQGVQALFSTIRGEFPDWPAKASLLAVGTFTPAAGGAAVPFRTYFSAELRTDVMLDPALVITDDAATKTVSVTIDPSAWFKTADGKVLNLSAFDFATTHQLVPFEVKVRDGMHGHHHNGRDD
ncbi:MAG TPA: hypothetical protein VFE05_01575 [Longimicrobiaceae bacterium]|nr:hypothetical protein [Longimicrobiaceae bacterium]